MSRVPMHGITGLEEFDKDLYQRLSEGERIGRMT
jgi:hypothetical protein